MLDTLKTQIYLYLNDGITLRALREWFAPYSIDSESHGSEFSRIAYEIMGDLADLDERHLSERNFKMNLQKLCDPRFTTRYEEIRLNFDGVSSQHSQTESIIREAVPA